MEAAEYFSKTTSPAQYLAGHLRTFDDYVELWKQTLALEKAQESKVLPTVRASVGWDWMGHFLVRKLTTKEELSRALSRLKAVMKEDSFDKLYLNIMKDASAKTIMLSVDK